MRAFLEIFRFECRLQAKTPLFIVLAVLFFVIHFLTARKLGIDVGIGAAKDAARLDLNAALAIIHNELVLSLFAIFPAVALVATAITRDHERRTAELFFVRPIREPSYVLGRFAGGLAFTLLASVAGVLGGLVSLTAPGVDPQRLGPFTAAPWWFVLGAVVVPNTVIVCALVFSATAAARSIAAAFCMAIVLALLPIVLQANVGVEGAGWLALADPFGTVAIVDVTRYWTGAELTTDLPGGRLWVNRALWLTIAMAAMLATVTQYRFVVHRKRFARRRAAAPAAAATTAAASTPALSDPNIMPTFNPRGTLAQLASCLRMELRAILRSPPFILVVALVVMGCASHFFSKEMTTFGTRSQPLTSLLIGFLDIGLAMQLVLVIAYYAGVLVHRERQARVAEIADASPVPTRVTVLSKIGSLWIAITLLLGLGIATFIILQAASGYARFELGLYLKGLILYGFNHYMLVVPTVLIHLLLQNRWLGTLAFLAGFAVLMSLGSLGLQDLLYTFRIPFTVHSDMNGFGHFVVRQVSVIAYWSAFLLLLTAVACVVAPRGYSDSLTLRLADIRSRITRGGMTVAAAAVVAFVAAGGWIFYNTHVLNEYLTTRDVESRAADYERKYRRYANLWTPRATAVDVAVDFFPAERRVESRGTLLLVNDSDGPLDEVLVTLNPQSTVNALALGDAQLVEEDAVLRVRRYRFTKPLLAGDRVTATWNFSWRHHGFGSSMPNEVAANGTFVDAPAIMPFLAYSAERELDDDAARRRQGLPPAARMRSLDDRQARRDLRDPGNRFLLPANFHAVLSTSEDQKAVTLGALQRDWHEAGRHYFEYEGNFPLALGFASARYDVVSHTSNGITIEIFHDPRHTAALSAIMNTATRGMDYYSREFSPFTLGTFRIFEYPRYSTRVRALAGGVAYNEGAGFISQFPKGEIDFVTAHELAHMWWGGQVRSANVQGRLVLNETLATYSALALIEHERGPAAVHPNLRVVSYSYLDGRSRERIEELPVIRTETQIIAYNKGGLAMYALSDVIGIERVNLGLRNFLEKYGNRPPPYPTTLELIAELRAVAGEENQALITDLFERITFYDLAVTGAQSAAVGSGYDVTIDVAARQLDADGAGVEKEVPLSAPFDVAVFGEGKKDPLYMEKHRLTSGTQHIVVRVPARPVRVEVDPYHKMIDRKPEDNSRNL